MTTIAKIINPQRRQDWLVVFGTDEVCLVSPVPQLAGLPGLPGSQLVYMADLTKLDADQRQRLITFIAARFQVPADVVARDLDTVGLPVLASDVTITSNDVGLLLTAVDDDTDWEAKIDLEPHDSLCLTCGGTGIIITCIDDMCVGGDHCIHGDGEEVCPECEGGY